MTERKPFFETAPAGEFPRLSLWDHGSGVHFIVEARPNSGGLIRQVGFTVAREKAAEAARAILQQIGGDPLLID